MLWHKLQGAGVPSGGGASIVQHSIGSLSTNPSVTTPSGLANGNLLVLTGAISASSWNDLNTDLSTQSLTLQNTFASDSNPSVFVATRVIDGGEAASYSLTSSGNNGRLAIMEIDGTFDVCGISDKTAVALTYNITGITVSNSNSLLVAIGGIGHDDTLTMPSGMTSQFNTSSDNVDPTLAVSYETVESGDTGVRTISRTVTSGGLGGVMFAVF